MKKGARRGDDRYREECIAAPFFDLLLTSLFSFLLRLALLLELESGHNTAFIPLLRQSDQIRTKTNRK